MTAASNAPLFGALPPTLFRLLCGPNCWFYADLLEHLDAELFGIGAGASRPRDVVHAIAEFMDRHGRGALAPEDEPPAPRAGPPASPASTAYARLVSTGWLVEHHDRYRRSVDLHGAARLLLELMLDMKKGRTRSYGGEVLQILSSLDAARHHPDERSEGVRNAARASRSFLNHLRAVAGALRAAEQHVSAQAGVAAMFGAFFDDFVARHLVEDYKRLHTQSNPFRFRMQIVSCAEAVLADPALLAQLAGAYLREGRAGSAVDAAATVSSELQDILRVFSALDGHLEAIEDISRGMERRLRNAVRHLERIAAADTAPVEGAMLALGRVAASDVPPGPLGLLRPCVPLGPAHLFQAARRRGPPARQPIRAVPPDPAFLAYQTALLAYQDRMDPAPGRIRAYLEQALPRRGAVPAAGLPLATLDDFVVFQRLSMLNWLDDPALARDFAVTVRKGAPFANGWITCPDFTIRRTLAGGGDA